MDRAKRTATKVTDYRRYHLSGDLDNTLQGRVGQVIADWESGEDSNMSSEIEKLQQQVAKQKEARRKAEEQLEEMKLRNEMENERLQTEEWELAMTQLKEAREMATKVHEERMNSMKEMMEKAKETCTSQTGAPEWLQKQLEAVLADKAKTAPDITEEEARKKEERAKRLEFLRQQQKEIENQIKTLTGDIEESRPQEPPSQQTTFLQQLHSLLTSKPEEGPQKDILRAMTSGPNRTTGAGGVNTLKPEVLSRITGEPTGMHEWLAQLNRADEGEWTESLFCKDTQAGSKLKSGMLEKATTNILVKQVWPQKNLGEDWAEEELEFK